MSAVHSHYTLLADLIVAFHLLYVLFAVGGQVTILAGWLLGTGFIRNTTFRIAHLIAVALVAVEAATGVLCPLTVWEYDLRQLAGQTVNRDISFVGRLARWVIFYDLPDWVFKVLHIGFGVLVVATFLLIPPRSRRRKN